MQHPTTARTPIESAVDVTRPAGVAPVRNEPPLPGRIGEYRILGVIGVGGMGVVYRAEQEFPRRIVALKVIKPGLTAPVLLKRFELEAQVLGRLQHPGIAHIYEAGIAELELPGGGRSAPQPYFAMEFIEGRALTEHAAARRLGLRERLELIAAVCDAVQHAHSKGVIHRDLKPGNILVTEPAEAGVPGSAFGAPEGGPASFERSGARRDPDTEVRSRSAAIRSLNPEAGTLNPVPKILDFGVSRVTAPDFAAATMETDVGQLLGTLPYMSPEQVGGHPDELDTRSDVYSLGVIAYELLTGVRPHDLRGKPLAEAARIIREVEPPRAGVLNVACRGEVETIVAKAMAKDRALRYQTAYDLALDIRRYLADEPILARPPSAMYQLRKFARRNRALVVAGTAVVLSLAAGFVLAARGYYTAAEERDRARDAEFKADQKRLEADKARAAESELKRLAQERLVESERARRESDALSKFLIDMFLALDPAKARGKEVTVREVLERAAQELPGQADLSPAVQGTVRNALGVAFHAMGVYSKAEEQFRAAIELRSASLGPEHTDTLASVNNLASAYLLDSRPQDAIPLLQQALAGFIAAKGERDDDSIAALNNLAHAMTLAGRYADAEPLLQRAYDLARAQFGPEEMRTLRTLNNLALCSDNLGKLELAEAQHRTLLEARLRTLGEDHPDTFASFTNLALTLRSQKRYAEAAELLERALRTGVKVLGPDHPNVWVATEALAGIYERLEKWDLAAPLYATMLESRERTHGAESVEALSALAKIVSMGVVRGRFAEVEAEARRLVDGRRRVLPAGDWAIANAESLLGAVLVARAELAEAEPLLLGAYDVLSKARGESDVRTLDALARIVALMEAKGDEAAADEWRAKLSAARAAAATQPS